ncbi:MAG: signal peptidase II [Gemmatimonadota bacterium]|jgi:signal peptidase II|nr:signal peptidase II [Gemmatimonadota bacterium]
MTEEAGVTVPGDAGLLMTDSRKVATYGGLAAGIVVLDQLAKYAAQRFLPLYEPVPVLGDFFRLTYIYNTGAAFGLHLGAASRYIFLALTVVCLGVLFGWFRRTPATDRLRLLAIALVSAGALGNFIDRLRSTRGVVDFLDFGFPTARWPVFNVADIGVTVGAILLAISLWREDREASRADEQ